MTNSEVINMLKEMQEEFFVGHVTHAWVINELLGRKIAELEKGANDENITTEN